MSESTLKQTINDTIKAAMKAGEKDRLTTLRMITATIKQREVDERIELDDAQITAILNKMVKERRDAIEKFTAGNRQDLAEKEALEITIIQTFLPEALPADKIDEIITQTIAELGAESMKDMGKVMGQLKPKLEGRADMSKVSAKIKDILS